jgi:tricorn protease
MQEIFLIVRASRIELWLGLRVKASVGFLEGGEYQLVISDQFGRTKNKIAIENPTFYYKPSWSPDSKYLSFYNENRTLWIVEVSNW